MLSNLEVVMGLILKEDYVAALTNVASAYDTTLREAEAFLMPICDLQWAMPNSVGVFVTDDAERLLKKLAGTNGYAMAKMLKARKENGQS